MIVASRSIRPARATAVRAQLADAKPLSCERSLFCETVASAESNWIIRVGTFAPLALANRMRVCQVQVRERTGIFRKQPRQRLARRNALPAQRRGLVAKITVTVNGAEGSQRRPAEPRLTAGPENATLCRRTGCGSASRPRCTALSGLRLPVCAYQFAPMHKDS